VDLDIAKAKVTSNNLGGLGPKSGEQAIRYSGVGTYNGDSLDLVVTVRAGEYVKNNVRPVNGMICGNLNSGNHGTGHVICNSGGHFAQINVRAGPKSYKAQLRFTVQKTKNKQAVTLPGFAVTFFDIDQNQADGNSPKKQVREIFTVHKGYHKAVYDKTNKDVDFSESGGVFTAKSKKLGHGCDNPVDPLTSKIIKCQKKGGRWIEVDQKKRSAMFMFKSKSYFDVDFETVCNKCAKDGRNFLFGFRSFMADDCR